MKEPWMCSPQLNLDFNPFAMSDTKIFRLCLCTGAFGEQVYWSTVKYRNAVHGMNAIRCKSKKQTPIIGAKFTENPPIMEKNLVILRRNGHFVYPSEHKISKGIYIHRGYSHTLGIYRCLTLIYSLDPCRI